MMKKINLFLVSLSAFFGFASSFTSKSKGIVFRTYGVLSKSGSNYNVELYTNGICTSEASTVCSVRFGAPGTVTTIPTSAAIPLFTDAKFLHTN
jgi:hypothetical protein